MFEIFIVLLSTNDPIPLKTVILFFDIKKSIPLVVCSTTEFFLEIILFRSTLTVPSISIP